MANTIKIKHGASMPTTQQLEPYELGYFVKLNPETEDYLKSGNLYIRQQLKNNSGLTTEDKIIQLTGLAATGLVNDNNYLQLPAIAAATSNTGRILVADGTIVYYKTPADILSEIGALSTGGGTVSGNLTISGKLTANGGLVTNSYGKTNPNIANNGQPLSGTAGQLYFVVTE